MLFLPAGSGVEGMGGVLGKENALTLPVDKSEVISRLARVHKREHRRASEILIGVQPEGERRKYFGKSLDFSETGVAFECNESLAEGQKVVVSFIAPNTRRRFILEAEIVRKKSDHPGSLYAYAALLLAIAIEDNTKETF